jgi:MSHA biogenesis protein MshJ
MNLRLQTLRARYQSLSRRERLLAIGAGLVLTLGIGDVALIEPALRERSLLTRQLASHQTERNELARALNVKPADRNAGQRAQLAALEAELRDADRDFADIRNGLVQPQHMGSLLQSLLTEHRGLKLIGLKSLPVTPVSGAAAEGSRKAAASNDATSAATVRTTSNSAAANPAADETWLFRHGVQITVQGRYADMRSYLQALEDLPRRVHWGDVSIDARRHAESTMTVTLYTVSLEKSWWVL